MRQLLLLRGGMGVGKSTWVEENNLKQYTLCADDIRLLYQSPVLLPDGSEGITMNNDNQVWKTLKQLLRDRMKRGEFTVIDATHSKTKDINQYQQLAKDYRYRVTVVDFTDIPIETAKERNKLRPAYKRVPDEAIENVYSRFKTQGVPSWVTVIKPHEFAEKVRYTATDYSHYNKIHHIGDIHGCNTVLQEYLKDGLKDDELYIFVGDFIDRGVENAEVLEFMFSIMDKKNVIFLEGNHEQWLWRWANGEDTPSKEFNKYTMPQLEEAKISKKTARMFYRKLQQMVYYTYHTNDDVYRVLVTHGGLSHIPHNLLMVSTSQLISGVGDYTTDIDQHFNDNVNESVEVRGGLGNPVLAKWRAYENTFQIHGHRNIFGHETWATRNSFNLEGKIERGGQLRAVTLEKHGFTTHEVDNTVFDERHIPKKIDSDTTVEELVAMMKDNRYIKENKMPNDISSFNFSSQAFYRGVWDMQTMRARGLFINTKANEIVARSYDKFFNVNEREETSIPMLKKNMEFPITVREKPNGYLGILGYDRVKNELVFASKSSTKSEHAKWFKGIFESKVSDEQLYWIKKYMKDNNVTLTFEVIDPINDPHIIKYDEKDIILLDVINNNPAFSKMNYENLVIFAHLVGLDIAEVKHVFTEWSDFQNWYDNAMADDFLQLEGYIIEDNTGFMTKLKLPYYNFWKRMRTVKEKVASGRPFNTGMLISAKANYFYGFIKDMDREELKSKDIITLREEYYKMLK
jgi:predicted kinase